MLELWPLFIGSFLSSTLLPGGSEILLVSYSRVYSDSLWHLLIVASVGNTLGGLTSFLIGRMVLAGVFTELSHQKYQRGLAWVGKYGSPILLLSWVPLIGDPLCLVAGWMKVGLFPAIVFIFLGKALRYGTLLWVFI